MKAEYASATNADVILLQSRLRFQQGYDTCASYAVANQSRAHRHYDVWGSFRVNVALAESYGIERFAVEYALMNP